MKKRIFAFLLIILQIIIIINPPHSIQTAKALTINEFAPLTRESLNPISRTLRVDPLNKRYFMDGNGKVILLSGSHTWSNLQDNGGSFPPPGFYFLPPLYFFQN